MIARLRPPEIKGTTIAKANRPSSGIWNIIDCTVAMAGKLDGSKIEKRPTSAMRRIVKPTMSPRAPWRIRRRAPTSSDTDSLRRPDHALPPAPGAARQSRDACRQQNGETDHDLEKIGGYAEDVEPVLQHRQKDDTEDHAGNAADAAREAGPSQHRGGEHVELVADKGVRDGLADPMRLDQPGESGHEAEISVRENVHGCDVHPEPARGLGIAAHGVELAAGR